MIVVITEAELMHVEQRQMFSGYKGIVNIVE